MKEVETPEPTLRPQTLIEPDKSQISGRAALQILAAVLQHAGLNAQAASQDANVCLCVAVGGEVEAQGAGQEVSSGGDEDAERRF